MTTVIDGADQRVEPAAIDVRGAAAALAARRPALAGDVGERQHDRAQKPVGIGEVGEQVRRRASGCGRGSCSSSPCSAARRRRTCCPGSCRRAASRPVAGRAPLLDLGRVARDGWRRACAPTPSRTSGRRACPSCCRAAGRPGWRPSGEERSHSQPISLWLPASSQRAIVGTCPSRIASRSTPSPRPSISNRITPGTSVRFSRRARARARRRTTRRLRASPSTSSSGASERRDEREHRTRSRGPSPNDGALPSTT